MRLLTGYIGRELLLSFAAILSVLLLVILGGEVARLLSEALEGKISPDLVFKLVLLKIPVAMEILLPLSMLLSVMLTFGRLHHDREMEVMSASGIGSGYFIRVLFVFGVIIGFLALWLSVFASPWAMQQERYLLAEGQMRVQIKALSGGRFTTLSSSNGVFYAEKVTPDGKLQDVFIHLHPKDRDDLLLSAPQGKFRIEGDRTILVLMGGQLTEGALGQTRVSVHHFEEMSVWLPDWQVKVSGLDIEAMDTLSLWQMRHEPRALAHIEWRVFVGVSVLVMALMGWRLAQVGPRQGRYARMAWGLGFYLLFTQLAITVRAEVQRAGIPPLPGVFVLLILPVLLWMPWRQWWLRWVVRI